LNDDSLAARAQPLRAALQERGVAAADIQLVRSPYRVCPIGAHSDHQVFCVESEDGVRVV
jgi:hypothetical protein